MLAKPRCECREPLYFRRSKVIGMWIEHKGPDGIGAGERNMYRDWLRYHAVYLPEKMEGVSD